MTCPQVVLVPHNGRSFSVKVEAGSLPPGLHYAEVQGLDAVAEWRGPLFRVPITGEGGTGKYRKGAPRECSRGQLHRPPFPSHSDGP